MLRPYADLLRLPGALAFSASGFLARMPISIDGLGIVLLVSATSGSYALAGALAATFQLAASLLSPIGSRLVDRWGQFRLLPILSGLSGLALLAFAWGATHDAPTAALAAAVFVAGATQPNIGSLVRARWAWLLRDSEGAVRTAFALESVVDEVIFVVGPPLATVLATTVAPASAVLLGAALTLIGGAVLTLQRSTQPPASRHDDLPRAKSAIRLPGVAIVAVTFVLLGTVFGATEVTTVAFARERGIPAVAGALLAMFSLGSLVAGLVFGTRNLRRPLPQQFWVALAALTLLVAPFPFLHVPWLLGAAMLMAGLGVAPSLIIGTTLVESIVPGRQLTEAITWATTGIALGLAISASLAGAAIDHVGTSAGYAIAAVGAACAATLAYATRGPLTRIWRAESTPGAGPEAALRRD